MRRSPVPVAVIALAVLLVAVLAYGLASKGAGNNLDSAVQRGERPFAPADATRVKLPKLGEQGDLSLDDLRGKITVVNVWASWCPPCEDEAPLVSELHDALAKTGEGQVLGVTHIDSSDDSLEFAKEFGLSFPSVRDVNDDIYDAFGASGPPETYVLDGERRVVAISRGAISREFVRDALKAAGAKATIPEQAPEGAAS